MATTDECSPRVNSAYMKVKAVLDFTFAAILLIALAPLLLLLALIIRLESAGPAIYTQERTGANGKTFTICKFRTMKPNTPYLSTEEMQRSGCNPYTRVGVFLRRTNLDELPQLLNILKGEMSFIGPRPPLTTQHDVNALRQQQHAYFARPGITGLAQARGRDDLDVETKVSYDAEYCRRMSLWFDLKVLGLTALAVISGRGNK